MKLTKNLLRKGATMDREQLKILLENQLNRYHARHEQFKALAEAADGVFKKYQNAQAEAATLLESAVKETALLLSFGVLWDSLTNQWKLTEKELNNED